MGTNLRENRGASRPASKSSWGIVLHGLALPFPPISPSFFPLDHLTDALSCRYNLDMERRLSKSETADQMAHECIAVRVRLINRVISALYDEALRPFGLRISQANILSAIGLLGESRPADISRALRIEKSTLSRDVELMKKKGWLESDPPAGAAATR